MDDVFSSLIDVDELREQVSVRVQKQYRVYAAVLVAMSLIIGAAIGARVTRERVQPGGMLTPPPYWGQVCGPAAVKDELVALPTATPQPVRVYVSGAVAQPGVVTLSAGSLLADALEVVGGAAADADLDGVNLAAPLADNQHVIVPRRTATPQPVVEVATPVSLAPAVALVNINTASAAELETLPHIGPAMAQRIIAYREAHGPFERIEDIQNVEGIGEIRYKDLAPLIAVAP